MWPSGISAAKSSQGIDQVLESSALRQVRQQFYGGSLDTCSGCNFFRRPRRSDFEAVKRRIAALPAETQAKIDLR
jgi:hypothetical protein